MTEKSYYGLEVKFKNLDNMSLQGIDDDAELIPLLNGRG